MQPNIAAGLIVIWSGSIGSIPVGWVLCDGNAGTPDLRDRFVIGAGSSFAVDDSGGGVGHTHTLTADPHTHDFPAGVPVISAPQLSATTAPVAATGEMINNGTLPPYYALAYIMKT